MARTLLLLRHAKSSWKDDRLRDYDRPLARRGRRDAPAMGRWIADEGLVPEVIACSAAERARQTCALLLEGMGEEVEVAYEDELYGASAARLLDRVRDLPDGADPAMLVGHNPGMEDLAGALAGGGASDAVERMRRKYPTCALAVVSFDVERWADCGRELGTLERFVRPADLPRRYRSP